MTSDTRFMYDGWNLIAELEMNQQSQIPHLKASYAWGLDLSGTAQGAGGVGGLVFTALYSTTQTIANNSQPSPTATLAPGCDGNGNILAWLDCASGQVVARQENDPFGNVILQEQAPSVAGRLGFGFSTKYTDAETGWCYYGFRYYSSELGRWLNRDPIGARGGINLYRMVGNDAVNRWDYLGLEPPNFGIPIPDDLKGKDCIVHLLQMDGNDAIHSMTTHKPANGAVVGNPGADIRPDGTLSPGLIPRASEKTKTTEIYLCCCLNDGEKANFEGAKKRQEIPGSPEEPAPGPGSSCTSSGCGTWSAWRNAGVGGVLDPSTGQSIDPKYLNRPNGGRPLNPEHQHDTPDILRNMLRDKCRLVRTVTPYKP